MLEMFRSTSIKPGSWRLPAMAYVVTLATTMFAFGMAPAAHASADNDQRLALGKKVYDARCASCHGANLEGQGNWRQRLPSGRLPAPPHDATGHTWHHADRFLIEITKFGVTPFAPKGYESDMPAFEGKLGDAEIQAVIEFIKSTWPPNIRARQAQISGKR
jgi:mono/diheme cytochrome c family protein